MNASSDNESDREVPPFSAGKDQAKKEDATSHSLIDQLKTNDSTAWRRMYVHYEPLIKFWCRKANVPAQDVNDLVQDVFQTVAKSIEQFSRRPTGSFRGWLRAITNSRVVDWRRRNRGKDRATGGSTAQSFFLAHPFDVSSDHELSDVEEAEQKLIDQMHRRALSIIRDRFQTKTWTAFWMVVVEGKTPKEVAEQLSISPATVRVAKSRVLHRLRAELGENGQE